MEILNRTALVYVMFHVIIHVSFYHPQACRRHPSVRLLRVYVHGTTLRHADLDTDGCDTQ